MTAAEIIGQVLAAGGQITADGPDLVLTAPRPLSADLLDRIKTHKPDIVKALGQPAAIEAARSRRLPYTAWRSAAGDRALARRIRPMNEGAAGGSGQPGQRPLPAADLKTRKAALAHPDPLPLLSAAAYELVGYFEERLAAVQRYPLAEMHMNSRPPTVTAVRAR